MAKKPALFIGSSAEGRKAAYAIQSLLFEDAEVHVWDGGVFELGQNFIDSLTAELERADFAVLVLSADDVTVSRKKQSAAPRDNVLFELGLFMGGLDRDRCYFAFDTAKGLKLPTDLAGVTAAPYNSAESEDLQVVLGKACNQIRERITKLGPRPKFDKSALATQVQLRGFCERIAGHWWERIRPDVSSALSFVTIEPDPVIGTVKLRGRSFGRDGALVATWATAATCVDPSEQKIFYYWRGRHPNKPAEPYEGFAEMAFHASADGISDGEGVFSDANLTNMSATTMKSFDLKRCTQAEVDEVQGGGDERIANMVRKKLARWT